MSEPHRGAATDDLAPARAIIDLGSNTVRLVIYGGPDRAPVVLHNEKVTARLGKGVAESGRLSKKASASALAALARYRCLLDLKGVSRVDVVATAAARDAADGPEFLAQVAALGFSPRLLAGEEEALTSATGVLAAFPGAAGVVADLGGGSLELVDIAGGQASHGVSLPLGTLRLAALRAGNPAAFANRIGGMIGDSGWTTGPGATLYLVGGSLRAFARAAMQQMAWPADDPHGFELPADKALAMARNLAGKSGSDVAPIPGISAARLASLPDAAALLLALIRALAPSRLVFSSWGLREGVLFTGLDPEVDALDPLAEGVAAFAAHQGCTREAARAVTGWTGAVTGAGDATLRHAATALSLAAAAVEPNLRAELAVAWALRKRWIGIDARGRAMLAAALLANTGALDLTKSWRQLAPAADLAAAQAWGLAVRLCRRFSGGSPAALAASSVAHDGGVLRLTVTPAIAALVNEGVERDLKALAQHLGLKPVWEAA